MTREKHNTIVINVNSEAVQNKSLGMHSETRNSNITPLPKFIYCFLYLHKNKIKNKLLMSGSHQNVVL
jgi:hypothetical protein